jgi:hypothetical protein
MEEEIGDDIFLEEFIILDERLNSAERWSDPADWYDEVHLDELHIVILNI